MNIQTVKLQFGKYKKVALFFLIALLVANVTRAERAERAESRLSFDFGTTVSEFMKNTSEAVTGVFSADKKGSTDTATSSEERTEVLNVDMKGAEGKDVASEAEKIVQKEKEKAKLDMNICEIYDETFLNIMSLDLASTEAQGKIQKVEDTIEGEIALREEIFIASNKNLTSLQKKEKIIFKEMKKELGEAKNYYVNVDEKVLDISLFLEGHDCDDKNEKKENNLKDVNQETVELIEEEKDFRKSFAASLKDKISVLQKEVKDIKEDTKEVKK